MRIIGCISILIVVFIVGVAVGQHPTRDEQQAKLQDMSYKEDITNLSDKYASLYSMCEAKYQAGISGDLQQAFILRGEMTNTEKEVKAIRAKYGVD